MYSMSSIVVHLPRWCAYSALHSQPLVDALTFDLGCGQRMLEETYTLLLKVCGRGESEEFDFLSRTRVCKSCTPSVPRPGRALRFKHAVVLTLIGANGNMAKNRHMHLFDQPPNLRRQS